MGFLKPKVPTPPAAPNTPVAANAAFLEKAADNRAFASLIATAASGLKRKASTQKTSLVGGG